MSTEKESNWKEDYFNSLRTQRKPAATQPKLRWGGTGTVAIIYYLADSRVLDYVAFNWRIVTDQGGLTAPRSFQIVPLSLLPHLERAQSTNREVFVDFFTDEQGGSAEVITIATL